MAVRAQADPPFGGIKCTFDSAAEPFMFPVLLAKGLDDFHGAQGFRDHCTHIRYPVLAGAGDIGELPADKDDRQHDDGNRQQQSGRQGRSESEQIDDPAEADHDIAKRDRYRCSHNLFDHRRIRRHPRSDFRGPVFLEKARRQTQQIVLNGEPDIRDHPFSQPADKIEAEGGCDSQNRDNPQQTLKIRRDIAVPCYEALVDDGFEARRDRQRRRGRDQQGKQRQGNLLGIVDRPFKNHPQVADLFERCGRGVRFGRNRFVVHKKRLAARPICHNQRFVPIPPARPVSPRWR